MMSAESWACLKNISASFSPLIPIPSHCLGAALLFLQQNSTAKRASTKNSAGWWEALLGFTRNTLDFSGLGNPGGSTRDLFLESPYQSSLAQTNIPELSHDQLLFTMLAVDLFNQLQFPGVNRQNPNFFCWKSGKTSCWH